METSNLLQYTSNQLKVMIRGVQKVAEEEQNYIDSRNDMLNGEDLSEIFETRQRMAIKLHLEVLEDCHAVKIALLTNLKMVEQNEKLLQQ